MIAPNYRVFPPPGGVGAYLLGRPRYRGTGLLRAWLVAIRGARLGFDPDLAVTDIFTY